MNYDIEFCSKADCKHLECRRNQNNIEDKNRLIWMGNYEKCEYWEEH